VLLRRNPISASVPHPTASRGCELPARLRRPADDLYLIITIVAIATLIVTVIR
jgi:hypothetical protein